MSYGRATTLVTRQVSLSDASDTATQALSAGVNAYNSTEQQLGAQALLQQQMLAAQSQSIDPTTILLLGGAGLVLLLIMKKRKG